MRVSDKETAAGVIKMFREFESLSSVTVDNITEEKNDSETSILEEDGSATIYFSINCVYTIIEHIDPATIAPETSASTAGVESID